MDNGMQIGALQVMDRAPDKVTHRGSAKIYIPMWWVRCKCGLEFRIEQTRLETNEVRSCGCDGFGDHLYKQDYE